MEMGTSQETETQDSEAEMWRPRNGERSPVETKDPETQGQRDVETRRNTGHGWDPAGGASRVLGCVWGC